MGEKQLLQSQYERFLKIRDNDVLEAIRDTEHQDEWLRLAERWEEKANRIKAQLNQIK